jgi:hypothetical protein
MPRTYQMKTKSFSYHELMSGKINRTKLEALVHAEKLSEETLGRIGHVGRFYQRVSKACPNPNLKISDVLTGDELQKLWNETGDEGVATGQCPLVHCNVPANNSRRQLAFHYIRPAQHRII